MQIISYHADLKDWDKLINTEIPLGIICTIPDKYLQLIYLSCKEGWYSFEYEQLYDDGTWCRRTWKLGDTLPTLIDWNNYILHVRFLLNYHEFCKENDNLT